VSIVCVHLDIKQVPREINGLEADKASLHDYALLAGGSLGVGSVSRDCALLSDGWTLEPLLCTLVTEVCGVLEIRHRSMRMH